LGYNTYNTTQDINNLYLQYVITTIDYIHLHSQAQFFLIPNLLAISER